MIDSIKKKNVNKQGRYLSGKVEKFVQFLEGLSTPSNGSSKRKEVAEPPKKRKEPEKPEPKKETPKSKPKAKPKKVEVVEEEEEEEEEEPEKPSKKKRPSDEIKVKPECIEEVMYLLNSALRTLAKLQQ
jgi:hypothetical protein